MKIRTATMDDLNEIANVEAECFPAAEAATKEEFAGRIRYYGNHFWIMLEEDKLIAFVDGFVTDEADLTDEMYEKAAMHNEDGAWQMIFGVKMLMYGREAQSKTKTASSATIPKSGERNRKIHSCMLYLISI